MKLKNLLTVAFLGLTLIPIAVVSLLIYKSGYNLSKESYMRNLVESISVQNDYITQAIENGMIADHRFTSRNRDLFINANNASNIKKSDMHAAFQNYLDISEDKFNVCILLNKDGVPFFTIGEKNVIDEIIAQLPILSKLTRQEITEFNTKNEGYSLGIITPLRSPNGEYEGSFVSVYNKYYIFKIISSYYKITDSSTYICRAGGNIITFRKFSNESQNAAIKHALEALTLSAHGVIDMRTGDTPILGYYQKLNNSPWYLVGFVDESLITAFTNRYVWVYFFIIIGVCVASVLLAIYFSHRVVKPINGLIKVMDDYQNNLIKDIPNDTSEHSYFEIHYLWAKFSSLMKTIMLVQHNYEGIYYLYQSSNMGDINIDIDAKEQTAISNKEIFQTLMQNVEVPKNACVVEKFVNCFCEKDQRRLMDILETMRDKHLSEACEIELYTPHLNQRWYHALVVPLYENDRLCRFFVQLRDISSFRQQEFKSLEQARRDSLTGLLNRSGFIENSTALLRNENITTGLHGLLFIDMDYFKLVNDNFGHNEGDRLLRAIGKALQDCVAAEGLASRFGGDEFAVFLPDTTAEKIQATKCAISECLVFPYQTETESFVVSASIGIAVWNHTDPVTLEELLSKADIDMYQAKKRLKQSSSAQR